MLTGALLTVISGPRIKYKINLFLSWKTPRSLANTHEERHLLQDWWWWCYYQSSLKVFVKLFSHLHISGLIVQTEDWTWETLQDICRTNTVNHFRLFPLSKTVWPHINTSLSLIGGFVLIYYIWYKIQCEPIVMALDFFTDPFWSLLKGFPGS